MNTGYVHKKDQPKVKRVSLKERLRIGRRLAASMEPQMTLQEVADKLGMSYQGVQKIEALALHKVQVRLQQIVNQNSR
jgi:DNA-directed RNA polymerase sigma subunit (sigma70/sigma32)